MDISALLPLSGACSKDVYMSLIIVIAMILAAGSSDKVEHKVEVDGKTYRVKVTGRSFAAFDKSLVTMRTPERGDRMRRAVRAATGCEPKDEYWEAAHMVGLLDCSGDKS